MPNYDTFCSHIFDYACLWRIRLTVIEEVRNYGKIVCIKNIFENGWWEDACPSSYLSGFAPNHKLQKPSKESGIFQSLGTISIILFTKKLSQKGGGHGTMAPLLNTLLRAKFRQGEALGYLITLIGRTKKRYTRS